MEPIDLAAAVSDIVRKILKRPELPLDGRTVAADVPGWDSFVMIEIIMEIEARFDISFETWDIDNLRNLGDLVLRVEDKRRARDANLRDARGAGE